jgi:OmpA-OmpF porin, OOP family
MNVLVRLTLTAIAALASTLPCGPAHAQATPDVKGSRDHPMLTRYPDSHITEYSKNFDQVEFVLAETNGTLQREKIEGETTRLRYFYNNAETQPSPLQVVRNYQNAIKAIGGDVVWEKLGEYGAQTTLKAVVGDKEVWVEVDATVYSGPTQSYTLRVVERGAMTQVVSASKMLDELDSQGFIALYINFDTNRWDLKPDAQATISEIVMMLETQPSLRLGVEGHTDNVGSAAANKTLSENRAKSVMQALIAQGIAADRLDAGGFGQERPLADNRTDEGRAKNRRVELVKRD